MRGRAAPLASRFSATAASRGRSSALLAQLGSDGFRPLDLGMARDDEVALSDTLEAAASRCDAIVASGGVSVGNHDVLRVVLGNLGGRSMRSLDIAVKPGEHVAVARLGEKRTRAAPRRCADRKSTRLNSSHLG